MFKFIRQFLGRRRLERANRGDSVHAVIDAYRALLKDSPNDPKLLNDLGFALRIAGNLEEAEACLRRAVELSDHCIPWNNLGQVLASAKRMGEAREAFQRAAKLDPADPHPRYNLTHIVHDHGTLEEFKQELLRFLQDFPDHAGAHNDLGCLYHEMKEDHKALECFEEAVSLDPDHRSNRGNLIRQLCDLGRYKDATPHLKVLADTGMNIKVRANDGEVTIDVDGEPFYRKDRDDEKAPVAG